MTKYLWQRMVKVILYTKSGKTLTFLAEDGANGFAIHFNIPFGDSGSAQTCTVSIYNLSKAHRDEFKQGLKVQILAGYKLDTGLKLIAEGAIAQVSPYTKDGVDGITTFTFKEGEQILQAQSSAEKENDKAKELEKKEKLILGKKEAKNFKVKTHSALSFAPGTNSQVIIRKIASDAGIKLTKLKLRKPKIFKRGYTAKGKPFALIQKLANEAGAKAYLRRGKVIIDDLSKDEGKNEHILMAMHVQGQHGGTGLMEHVTFGDGNDKDKTIQFKSFLRNQIATGSVITIQDPPFFTGTRRVKSGEFNCDDDDFSVTGEVYQSAKT